jgi:hypothetical protein
MEQGRGVEANRISGKTRNQAVDGSCARPKCAMRQHDSLRETRGTAGIKYAGEILAAAPVIRNRGCALDELLIRDHVSQRRGIPMWITALIPRPSARMAFVKGAKASSTSRIVAPESLNA